MIMNTLGVLSLGFIVVLVVVLLLVIWTGEEDS